jgi:O-antigen ligase
LTGVGVHCFPKAIGEKRFDENEAPKWQAAHNAYVQILTEVGIVGFGAFCGVILFSLRDLSRCRTRNRDKPGGEQLRLIAGSVQVAFVGSLITAFFLSEGYSVLFTLFFALSCSISRLCDGQVSDESRVEPVR